MPKANWGISASDVDEYDREDLYTPYLGDPPPSGTVYLWTIKKMTAVPATEDKTPQIRVGLQLKPRNKAQQKYKGYYITAFVHISDKTKWSYIPFLDALGVSGRDFVNRTITDESGNVAKIGAWKNDGKQVIAAQLNDNDPEFASKNPKKIGWMGEAPEGSVSDDDEDEDDFDDEDSTEDEDSDFFDEDEEEVKKPSRKRATARNGRVPSRRVSKATASRRRRR